MTARASIVIPAHNESAVIGRLLEALCSSSGLRDVEIVVACNGCTDETLAVAERFATKRPIIVLDLPQPSKQAALNAADCVATAFPRIYLDADSRVAAASLEAVVAALDRGVLAARPPLVYDLEGCSRAVRGFYRARSRTPRLMSALWGAGCYAVSEAGRGRWSEFPLEAADDLYVSNLFRPSEVAVVDAEPVVVAAPRTWGALVRTLHRVYGLSGGDESVEASAALAWGSTRQTLRDLLRNNSSRPAHLLDAGLYVATALAGRLPARGTTRWQRDQTNR